jgi:hypothetical protein
MITIEYLEVLFEAERDKDEIRFAQLFDAHMERHEQGRREHRAVLKQAEADRSIDCGGVV